MMADGRTTMAVMAVALGMALVITADVAAQTAARENLQIRPGAQAELSAQGREARLTQDTENAVPQRRIDRDALAGGRYLAVTPDRTAVLNASNFGELAAPGTVIVQQVRADAVQMSAPAALMVDTPAATTYKLGWQVVAPEVDWEAWARDSTGLIFDGSKVAYAGNFDVALVNSTNHGDRSALDFPISISVTAPGATAIEPQPFQIGTLGQWHSASITVPAISAEVFEISVSAGASQSGNQINLTVSRPTITLTPSATSIDGWGIGRVEISVKAQGVTRPEGLKVALGNLHGTLTPGSVVLDAQGFGTVGLRSSRHDGTTISVEDDAFLSAPINIGFDSPWHFLILAIVGGLAGAFVKGKGRSHWVMALATGGIAGLIMAAAYAVGINWLGGLFPDADLARGGEAIVFVAGAIGAFAGVGILVPDGNSPGPE